MKSSLLALPVLLSVILATLLTTSCSDPTLVGANLIEEDQVNVNVIDTITIRTYTEQYDSILTYSPFESDQLDDYVVGKLIDPVFGTTESTLYAQLLLENEDLDLSDATFDSLVLVLPVDSLAVYGQQPQVYGFEVHRIIEDIDSDLNVYSNETFAVSDAPIGTFSENFNPFVDHPVFNPTADSIQQVRQLRIRLNDDFAQELFAQDTAVFRSNAAFRAFFKGLQLTGTTENTGILGFDLNNTIAGMQLYYTTDTTARVFNFNFQVDGVRALNLQHNYSGSEVEELIEKRELGDSLFLLQGLGGLRGIIELPYITNLKDVIVNRAEIRVPIQTTDTDEYPVPENVLLRYFVEDELTDIDDLRFSVGNTAELFGGVVVEGEGGAADYYSFNISDHLQDMIDGEVDNRLVIQIFREDERAARAILNGANNSEPVTLDVIFTEL